MLAGYIDANTIIALASAVSALFALALFVNAHHQLTHNRKVERAYVKISHPSPGVTLDSSGHIWVTVSIKNHGRTPARVTDVVIKPVVVLHGDQLPTVPDYGADEGGGPHIGNRTIPCLEPLRREWNGSR